MRKPEVVDYYKPLIGKMKKEEGKNRIKGEGNITENKFLPGELRYSGISPAQFKLLFHILLAITNAQVLK